MDVTLDHIPFAWQNLDEITTEFDRLGLTPEYGGAHANGVTHMAVLGFDDQSYIECIAECGEGDHDFWPMHIRSNAGPAAWSVRVADVLVDAKRVLDAGYPIRGPIYGARERDDGTLVEWDRVEYGDADDRLFFPFAIQDRTPLSYRVTPSPSVAGGPLIGVGQVVIAVRNLELGVQKLRDFYRFPQPLRATVPEIGQVASFPGQPVALATPDSSNWLDDRLDRFRECPCMCLLATNDIDAACADYPLLEPITWPDGRIAFFESDRLGYRLGVVERS